MCWRIIIAMPVEGDKTDQIWMLAYDISHRIRLVSSSKQSHLYGYAPMCLNILCLVQTINEVDDNYPRELPYASVIIDGRCSL